MEWMGYLLKWIAGLTKFDWMVVAQWATKDSTLVTLKNAQQLLVVAQQCKARNGGIW